MDPLFWDHGTWHHATDCACVVPLEVTARTLLSPFKCISVIRKYIVFPTLETKEQRELSNMLNGFIIQVFFMN